MFSASFSAEQFTIWTEQVQLGVPKYEHIHTQQLVGKEAIDLENREKYTRGLEAGKGEM